MGKIIKVLKDSSPPFVIALVVLNGLSGRWGPESLRRLDLWSTRLGLISLVVICIIVFILRVGYDGLPKYDMWLLLGLTAFAFYDWAVNQGEEYRSATLRAHEAAAAGQTFVPPQIASYAAPTRAAMRSVRVGPLTKATLTIADDNRLAAVDCDEDFPALLEVARTAP